MFSGDNIFFSSLRSIIKKMHQISDRELIQYGISHSEMRILLFLYSKASCRQEELSHFMGIDRTNVGRSLKKLESLKYIVRERDPEDRRALIIRITEKGYTIRDVLEKLKVNIESTVTRGLNQDEYERLTIIFSEMDKNLSWDNYIFEKKR